MSFLPRLRPSMHRFGLFAFHRVHSSMAAMYRKIHSAGETLSPLLRFRGNRVAQGPVPKSGGRTASRAWRGSRRNHPKESSAQDEDALGQLQLPPAHRPAEQRAGPETARMPRIHRRARDGACPGTVPWPPLRRPDGPPPPQLVHLQGPPEPPPPSATRMGCIDSPPCPPRPLRRMGPQANMS